MRSMAQFPDFIKPFPIYLRAAGYYCTNNAKTDYQFKPQPGTWDESSNKAHWRNRPDKDQPFFAVFNYTGCHESGIANDQKYQTVTEGLTPHDRNVVARSLPPYYPDTPITRENWGRYYDVITAMDRWVGEQLEELEKDGLADDTIVIFWSDHGVGLPRAKRWLYESGMHVPLIVRMPKKFRVGGQGRPATTDDRLVSLMDLGPTVMNLAGVKIPAYLQGQPFLGPDLPAPRRYVFGARDRMDERYDIIRAVRDQRYKYIRNYQPWKAYYQYINTAEKSTTMEEIRRVHQAGNLPSAAAQFMAPTKPIEELYDIQADPHELHNLAGSKDHRDVLQRMRKAHVDWMTDIRDMGMLPEPEIVRREKAVDHRWGILHQDGSEALMQRIVEAALQSQAGPDALPALMQFATDPDAAVRYWAAIGIGNIGRDAKPAADRMIAALNDDSDSVRIAAARALCHLGQVDKALPVLVRELADGPQWTRLNAAIVLDEIDEDARPAIDALQAAMKPRTELYAGGKYVVRVVNRALNQLNNTNNVVD
jgi:uncharacterized sulfatase